MPYRLHDAYSCKKEKSGILISTLCCPMNLTSLSHQQLWIATLPHTMIGHGVWSRSRDMYLDIARTQYIVTLSNEDLCNKSKSISNKKRLPCGISNGMVLLNFSITITLCSYLQGRECPGALAGMYGERSTTNETYV